MKGNHSRRERKIGRVKSLKINVLTVTPLADWKEKWWVMVMGVGLDPELSKVVHALRFGNYPNQEGI